MKRVGILGGGIAGLSLAHFLEQDCEVLEKSDTCGGLCRSFEVEGFTFDLGGHIMFSRDKEILDFELALLKNKVNKLYRKVSVWFKQRHVKYPFENGLAALDPEDKFNCLYNFLENPQRPQNNLEDWIYNTFGKGLAELYLLPYNRKIWNRSPAEINTQWVDRIPKPPAVDIIKSSLGIDTEGYTEQLHFFYPERGGFQSLPDAFEELAGERVVKNFAVSKVRRLKDRWLVASAGEEREYEQIVCAMPIFDFIDALADVPGEVSRAVHDLKYNSLIVVMLGVSQKQEENRLATYFPQSNLPFHRIVYPGYLGRNYVPEGCSSIVAEITAGYDDPTWKLSDREITATVIDGLKGEGFVEEKHVVCSAVRRAKYAYPVFDLAKEKNLTTVQSFCREQGIELCGRFAEFTYCNSDSIIRSAKTVAARLT